jgi:hypothetical protein
MLFKHWIQTLTAVDAAVYLAPGSLLNNYLIIKYFTFRAPLCSDHCVGKLRNQSPFTTRLMPSRICGTLKFSK